MNPIPTWQSTLGNSAHIVAAGAVGQAMQQKIDALRERNAELEAEKCSTCKHFKQGVNTLVGIYEIDCFECKHYYASKWESDDIGGHPV